MAVGMGGAEAELEVCVEVKAGSWGELVVEDTEEVKAGTWGELVVGDTEELRERAREGVAG